MTSCMAPQMAPTIGGKVSSACLKLGGGGQKLQRLGYKGTALTFFSEKSFQILNFYKTQLDNHAPPKKNLFVDCIYTSYLFVIKKSFHKGKIS